MDSLPDPDALVLVAFLPSPRDLEYARLLGWYRIPLRSAPRLVAVDYLAFYQPASFGEHRWRVEYCAPVLGHELVTRRALIGTEPDHPRAGEEYFKIQLGALVALPRPILARRWKRLTFLYTTGAYLLCAETIADLVVQPAERRVLWRALRERAIQAQGYRPQELPDLGLDADSLAILLGIAALGRGERPDPLADHPSA